MNDIQKVIDDAIDAMMRNSDEDTLKSMEKLAVLKPEELLGELAVRIVELADTVDLNNIVATDPLPDTSLTNSIITALINYDEKKLRDIVNDDYALLLPVLVSVIVVLKKSPKK